MKIFKSIKWRLLIFYGPFLALLIAGVYAGEFQSKYDTKFNEIDDHLRVFYGGLLNFMQRPPPDEMGEPMPEGPPRPPPFRRPPEELQSSLIDYINNPAFNLPGTNRVYYVIWSPDGNEWIRSTNAPSGLAMPSQNGPRTRSLYREMVDLHSPLIPGLPPRSTLLIGLYVAPEINELYRVFLKYLIFGLLFFVLLLNAGWRIADRAIKPIENISATAVKISAGDLSQRINTAETESELGQLAAVLNSTFARLEAAFAQQKQFASDAAHELRTPISVILTQTQAALSREREAQDYKQTVEACQRAAQRMRKLISALLELARLDAGQEQMKRLRFDFSKTVSDCVELIRPLADESGVKILTELATVEIDGDPERLAQAVTNLLSNAIQYNHDGGHVRIKVKLKNGMAILNVSDTGQGISAEDLPRVFERFYRADKSRSSGNAGLGLAISKAIITAHGGNIDVASEENVGTTFKVRLPASIILPRRPVGD